MWVISAGKESCWSDTALRVLGDTETPGCSPLASSFWRVLAKLLLWLLFSAEITWTEFLPDNRKMHAAGTAKRGSPGARARCQLPCSWWLCLLPTRRHQNTISQAKGVTCFSGPAIRDLFFKGNFLAKIEAPGNWADRLTNERCIPRGTHAEQWHFVTRTFLNFTTATSSQI